MQWVKLLRYCVEYRDSPTAVQRRVKRGIWAEGRHTMMRDGHVWINLAEVVPWIKREKHDTYLYVVGETGADKPIKIGIADNLEKRLAGLQTGNARKLESRASFLFDSVKLARDAERETHRHFMDSALCGEWFDVADTVAIDWITATYTSRGQLRQPRTSEEVFANE